MFLQLRTAIKKGKIKHTEINSKNIVTLIVDFGRRIETKKCKDANSIKGLAATA